MKGCVNRCNKTVPFITATDEGLHTTASRVSGAIEEMQRVFFSTQYSSPILASMPFMEIHKAVPYSPSQPPVRTQVKPHSLQPPALPWRTGKKESVKEVLTHNRAPRNGHWSWSRMIQTLALQLDSSMPFHLS